MAANPSPHHHQGDHPAPEPRASTSLKRKFQVTDKSDDVGNILKYLIPLCGQLPTQDSTSDLFSVLLLSMMLHSKFVPYKRDDTEIDSLEKIELKLPDSWLEESPKEYNYQFYQVGYFNIFYDLIATNNTDGTMLINLMKLGTDDSYTILCEMYVYVDDPESLSIEDKFSHINGFIKEFNDTIITPALNDLKNIDKELSSLFKYLYPLVEQLQCKDSETDLFFILVFAIFKDNEFMPIFADEDIAESSGNKSKMNMEYINIESNSFKCIFFPIKYCNYKFELTITNDNENMILNFRQLDQEIVHTLILESKTYVSNPNASLIEQKYSNLADVSHKIIETLIVPVISVLLTTENLVSDEIIDPPGIFKYLIPLCKQIKRTDSKKELLSALILAVMFENNFRVFESENDNITTSLPDSWKLNDENKYISVFYPIGYNCKCELTVTYLGDAVAIINFYNIGKNETYGALLEVDEYIANPEASLIEMKFSQINKAISIIKDELLSPGRCSLLSTLGVASASLVGLPSELITKIMLLIGGKNTLNLAATCYRLRLHASDNSLWKILFAREYPQQYIDVCNKEEIKKLKLRLEVLKSKLESGKLEQESEKKELYFYTLNLDCVKRKLESDITTVDWRREFIVCYKKNMRKPALPKFKNQPREGNRDLPYGSDDGYEDDNDGDEDE